jgi:hypothetical protein
MSTVNGRSPLVTGASLAVAAGAVYVACALLVVAAPAFAVRVLALLVHGLDITPLAAGAPPLDALDVLAGLIFWMAIAFVGGAVYAACSNTFARRAPIGS